MSAKTKTATKVAAKAKSRIVDAVHETAVDLYRLGFIDQRRMYKFAHRCCVADSLPARSRSQRVHLSDY
jgi:putative transcriptional regulator